jgi:hypothetical protein
MYVRDVETRAQLGNRGNVTAGLVADQVVNLRLLLECSRGVMSDSGSGLESTGDGSLEPHSAVTTGSEEPLTLLGLTIAKADLDSVPVS